MRKQRILNTEEKTNEKRKITQRKNERQKPRNKER